MQTERLLQQDAATSSVEKVSSFKYDQGKEIIYPCA